MKISWPFRLLAALRNRKKQATDVTSETLYGVEPSNLVTYKKNAWRKKRPGSVCVAFSKLRDAYVNILVKAAVDRGDMSSLVYGNGFSGSEFQFVRSVFDFEDEQAVGESLRHSSSSDGHRGL